MSNLSADEITILLIAAKGDSMMPIGRWRLPAESLVVKGLLSAHKSPQDPTGMFNLRITPAGTEAVEQEDTAYDGAFAQVVQISTTLTHAQRKARGRAEQIAVQLVDLAEASSKVTGDDKVEALRRWARIILERALEMMR